MKAHHNMDREPSRRVPATDYCNWLIKVIVFAAWIALVGIVIIQISEGGANHD